jgi:hypothetical protein
MFQWTAPAGVISQMTASTTGNGARATFHVFTTNNTITLPSIGGDLPLPGGRTFSWNVVGYGPNAHINEAAAANELETVSSNDVAGPAHAFTRSGSRTFTTQ